MPPAIEAAPAAPSTAPAAPAVVVTETRSDQFKDAKRIIDIGARFNAKEEAAQAIADGITVSEFQERLLERTKKAVASRTDTPLGLSPKEIKRFSIARAIAWQIAAKEGLSEEKRLAEEASYEREVILAANDIRTKQGRAPKGMYIPSEVLHQGRVQLTDEQARELDAKTRAVVSVSSSIGDSNVGATQQPLLDTASFAELLRPECLLMNFCTVVQGLTGEYQIPKHVSGAVGGWVSEDGTAPGTDAIFTQLKSDPHTAGGVAEITRRAILTSALDMESIIRTDLARGVGQTIDLAGYYGTGANGQPTGLTLTDGIKIVQFAGALSGTDHLSPEFTEAVAMETVIGQGNFKISPANGAYLFNAYGRGWAKTRQKFPGTPTGMTLWEPGETVNGYKTGISNQIQNGHWFFGDWKQLFMCLWSGLDLLVDPFTRSDKGRVRIVALQDIDYLNRRPEAFSFGYHY